MLIEIVTVKGYGNIHSHRLRLVAIGYEYATGCHDNGIVGHACAKFTCAVLHAHSKGIR